MCTVQKNEMIHDLIILVDLLNQQTSLRISVQVVVLVSGWGLPL